MTTREALAAIIPQLTDELVVHTTGYICRESCAIQDRPGNFYMIGSMGIAPAIGLGLARARPGRRVVVFDGDGALLMGMGTLAMTALWQPANFYHLVFDNGAYASTGHQPTHSRAVALDAVARACGYRRVARVEAGGEVASAFRALVAEPGPAFLLVKCVDQPATPAPRVPHEPPVITQRVMSTATQ